MDSQSVTAKSCRVECSSVAGTQSSCQKEREVGNSLSLHHSEGLPVLSLELHDRLKDVLYNMGNIANILQLL